MNLTTLLIFTIIANTEYLIHSNIHSNIQSNIHSNIQSINQRNTLNITDNINNNYDNYHNNESCVFCLDIVNTINQLIKVENMTLNKIERLVELLCEDIGGPIIQNECNIIINVIQYIYNQINNNINPLTICSELLLCPNSNIKKLK